MKSRPLLYLRIRLRKRIRPILMAAGVGFVLLEIVALSPSSLEGDAPEAINAPIEPSTLVQAEGPSLVTGIPQGRIPDYSVKGFDYVSTVNSEKQWKIVADNAEMFETTAAKGETATKLVHARVVTAYLYDPDEKSTLITGREAKYFMNRRDLEVFGDVVTTFPDGFVLHSDYLRYLPDQHRILIPQTYPVQGASKEESGQTMSFDSHGLDFAMADSLIILPQAVTVVVDKPLSPSDHTTIESDHCVIHRDKQIAYFTMYPTRPLEQRFVHITQPELYAKSRRAELNYGDFSQMLKYLVAYDDVFIKQLASKKLLPGEVAPLKYATGGRADFDQRRNVIVLTKFPQVYQDNDTVTGDIILMHRDSDVVEVENSNAFSEGDPPGPSPSKSPSPNPSASPITAAPSGLPALPTGSANMGPSSR